MFPIYSLHQARRPCVKGDLITFGKTFSHIRSRQERLADNLDVIIHANCIEEDDDLKYPLPKVGPLLGLLSRVWSKQQMLATMKPEKSSHKVSVNRLSIDWLVV